MAKKPAHRHRHQQTTPHHDRTAFGAMPEKRISGNGEHPGDKPDATNLTRARGNETDHHVRVTEIDSTILDQVTPRDGSAHAEKQGCQPDSFLSAVELHRQQYEQHHGQKLEDGVDRVEGINVELIDDDEDKSHAGEICHSIKVLFRHLPAPGHPARQFDDRGHRDRIGKQADVPAPEQYRGTQNAGRCLPGAARGRRHYVPNLDKHRSASPVGITCSCPELPDITPAPHRTRRPVASPRGQARKCRGLEACESYVDESHPIRAAPLPPH